MILYVHYTTSGEEKYLVFSSGEGTGDKIRQNINTKLIQEIRFKFR
jgi:hypothetical protein